MWRRVAVYCLFGFLVCIGTFVAVDQLAIGPPRGIVSLSVMCFILGILAVAPTLLVWRSAIRIDADGLWRRRLVRWDLWSRDAFLDGKILDKSGADNSFIYQDKSWYWRSLCLDFLPEEQQKYLREVIRGVRTRSEIQIPEEITISFGLRRRARFSPFGIQLWSGKEESVPIIPWAEISPFKLTCTDHDRRDFRSLEFRAPANGKPILLTFEKGNPTWRGAEAELLTAFLQKHTPSRQVEVNALRGPPSDMDEYQRRLADLQRDLRRNKILIRLTWAFPLVCLIVCYLMVSPNAGWNLFNWGFWQWIGFSVWILLTGPQLLVAFAIAFSGTRNLKERQKLLEEWYRSQIANT